MIFLNTRCHFLNALSIFTSKGDFERVSSYKYFGKQIEDESKLYKLCAVKLKHNAERH